jgi:hypothetical protein
VGCQTSLGVPTNTQLNPTHVSEVPRAASMPRTAGLVSIGKRGTRAVRGQRQHVDALVGEAGVLRGDGFALFDERPLRRPVRIHVANVLGAHYPLGIRPAVAEHLPHLLRVTVDQHFNTAIQTEYRRSLHPIHPDLDAYCHTGTASASATGTENDLMLEPPLAATSSGLSSGTAVGAEPDHDHQRDCGARCPDPAAQPDQSLHPPPGAEHHTPGRRPDLELLARRGTCWHFVGGWRRLGWSARVWRVRRMPGGQQSECLLQAQAPDSATVYVRLRFLQLQHRLVEVRGAWAATAAKECRNVPGIGWRPGEPERDAVITDFDG